LDEGVIIKTVSDWLVKVNFLSCHCSTLTKKWLNVWANGDIISGPLKNLKSEVEDYRTDPGFDHRNLFSTISAPGWHFLTSLNADPNGMNQTLINYIKNLIISNVNK
jgi:hypothetical protein